jgi:hypothetical protein
MTTQLLVVLLLKEVEVVTGLTSRNGVVMWVPLVCQYVGFF